MISRAVPVGVVMAALLLLPLNGSPCVAANTAQELELKNFDEIYATLKKLKGRSDYDDTTIHFLVAELAKNEKVMKSLESLAKFVQSQEGNQKEEFLEQLMELSCHYNQDKAEGCALRARVDALEREIRELKGQRNNDGREPTPAPVGIIPIGPAPAGPPRTEPPLRVWVDRVDFITDRRDSFCPRAVVIARHVKVECGDGDNNCIGDMYRDCVGRYVLLRRTAMPLERSVLVAY